MNKRPPWNVYWSSIDSSVQFSPPMSLSSLIRFGTSTWTYEGWQGKVYKREYKKTTFTRECLGEYCQFLYNGEPLFRTVGNDSTFYRPPTATNASLNMIGVRSLNVSLGR